MDLGSRLRSRSVIDDHDGASGARLERAVLDDGASLILKLCNHETDLSMLIPGRIKPLDVQLRQEGHLDRLPEVMGHAVRGAWLEDGSWVLAMDDLGDRLLSYRSVLSRPQCRQILAAACAMHDRFAGNPPSGLWSAEDRMTVFAPRTMRPYAAGDNALPGWCLQGWERFDALAPLDVRDLVHGIHQDPQRLAQVLADLGPTTLLLGRRLGAQRVRRSAEPERSLLSDPHHVRGDGVEASVSERTHRVVTGVPHYGELWIQRVGAGEH